MIPQVWKLITLKRCFANLGKTKNKYSCHTVKQNTFCFLHQHFPLFGFYFSCTIWLQLIHVLLQQMRTGFIKERRSSGSNAKKQHNGFNSISINRDNVVFTNCCTNDQRYGRTICLVCVWRQKRPSLLDQVFLNPRLLLSCVSSQRPINTLLQPCKHPHQCPFQKAHGCFFGWSWSW